MSDHLPFSLEHLPFVLIAVIVAFTFHEYAHASLAYRFGDPTAYRLGRVTLNPVSHLSLLGFLFILILGFGWARPVPVDRSHFKYPRLMSIAVSAAGPLSNLMVAIAAAFIVYGVFAAGWLDGASVGAVRAVGLTFGYMMLINLLLCVFNMIPLPPLDGYRILEDVVPPSVRRVMSRYEPWGVYIFLLIVFITPLYNATIGPILMQVNVWNASLRAAMEQLFGAAIDWRYIFQP